MVCGKLHFKSFKQINICSLPINIDLDHKFTMAIQRKTWILGLLSKIPSLVLLSGQAMTCKLHKSNLFQFVLIVSAQPGTHCSKSMELWHYTNNHLSHLHTKLVWISKQNKYISGISESHSCVKRSKFIFSLKLVIFHHHFFTIHPIYSQNLYGSQSKIGIYIR